MEKFLNGAVTLHSGDCIEVLRSMPENSIDSCCTDPPYGLQFMGKQWDKLWRDKSAKDKAYVEKHKGKLTSARRRLPDYSNDKSNARQMQEWHRVWAKEVLRVLKPGGHMLAFCGTRTYHRMASAIEDAGFEVRDCILWLYGSGFPKSLDISKAIDKAAGAKRKVIRTRKAVDIRGDAWGASNPKRDDGRSQFMEYDVTEPATDNAKKWSGWGTALKPACEIIILVRKPLSEKTVAANVLKWGTGALNIDECRIGVEGGMGRVAQQKEELQSTGGWGTRKFTADETIRGRFPANVVHDGSDEVVAGFPDTISASPVRVQGRVSKGHQGNVYGKESRPLGRVSLQPIDSGSAARFFGRFPANVMHDGSEEVTKGFPESASTRAVVTSKPGKIYAMGAGLPSHTGEYGFDDEGSSARFFYTSKADKDDRLSAKHPTVKPVDLMQYLIRLVTPKGGTVLDPFSGTGTTGEAAWREYKKAILIEREKEHQEDIRRRMRVVKGGADERAKAKMVESEVYAGALFNDGAVSRKLRRGREIGPTGLRTNRKEPKYVNQSRGDVKEARKRSARASRP